ncbi:MAG: hypothetical protein ACPGJV_08540 [Bacteriovoracaceae bacterium]
MFKILLTITLIFSYTYVLSAEEICLELKRFNSSNNIVFECTDSYHHFKSRLTTSPRRTQRRASNNLEIGSFNLYHLGGKVAKFKDLDIVAKVIDNFDVLAAQEIQPVLGRDRKVNEALLSYIGRRNPRTSEKKIYVQPGYLSLLKALQKLDPSWSLITSPLAESSPFKEYVGFYYRRSKVELIEDEHCLDFKSEPRGKNFACYPALNSDFLDDDYESYFSRRPYLAKFRARRFDFTLMTSHFIHNAPSDINQSTEMLSKFFGATDMDDLHESGVNSMNYARVVEMKVILKFMNQYHRDYSEGDLIFLGDMNLEPKNSYVQKILSRTDYSLDGEDETTLTNFRYDSTGQETKGFSKSYDHVMWDRSKIRSNCSTKVSRYDFTKGKTHSLIAKKYMIRSNYVSQSPEEDFDYLATSKGLRNMNEHLARYKRQLLSQKVVKRNKIVLDNYRVDEQVSDFEERVFLDQLYDDSFYRVYKELISDHFPIHFSCNTSRYDND